MWLKNSDLFLLAAALAILFQSNLVLGCSSNQYYNSALGQCRSCAPSCATCDRQNWCNTCKDAHCTGCYGLNCYDCQDGYYLSGGTGCAACSQGCKTCLNSTRCIQCLTGYTLVDKACQPVTPTNNTNNSNSSTTTSNTTNQKNNNTQIQNNTFTTSNTTSTPTVNIPLIVILVPGSIVLSACCALVSYCMYKMYCATSARPCQVAPAPDLPEGCAGAVHRPSEDVLDVSGVQIQTVSLEGESCCICLDDRPTARTACGHLFHPLCLVEWNQRSRECPLCRAAINHAMLYCQRCRKFTRQIPLCLSSCIRGNHMQCFNNHASIRLCNSCRANRVLLPPIC